ncbi:hypothetical protein NIBR502772_20945 [Pseudarthrobacter sp. NIBRBAC000502772]|uniref:hypothetical protein n=1 Tax=Pseudarthrobacter sp. NIBRBAC000502772 TaxID=2590775 RepID=UPI001132488A|nr:hypothetical protein NIBR502772_20945 [Pseudarthrobacter sp. NIBRBAC000502772]
MPSDQTPPNDPVPPSRGKIAERLLAGGIAIEAFTSDLFLEPVRKSLAVLLLLLGMLLSAGAAGRWIRVERSMRNKTPLPLPLIVPLLAGAGALAAAVVLDFILWR